MMTKIDTDAALCVDCWTDRPRVQLSLGSSLQAANIKEGDDVYFDCRSSALPPVTRLEWFHNVSSSLRLLPAFWLRPVPFRRNSLHDHLLTVFALSLSGCVCASACCRPQMQLQDKKLPHNVSAGIIITNQSLVLQRVGRHSAGRYRCTAWNREGETESDIFHLDVKCK